MPVLATLTEVKAQLEITNTARDGQLTIWIDQVEDAIADFIKLPIINGNHPLVSAEVTEYLDGTGSPRLRPSRRPITAVAEVRYDSNGNYGQTTGGFGTETVLVAGTDYSWNKSVLTRISGEVNFCKDAIWAEHPGSIKITYTAGFAAIPDRVKFAVGVLVHDVMRRDELGLAYATRSETMGKTSVTFAESQSQDVMSAFSILQRFAKV